MGNIVNSSNHSIIVDGVDYSYSKWSVVRRSGADFLAVNLRKPKAIERLNNGKSDMSGDKRMYMEVFGITLCALTVLFEHVFYHGSINWPAIYIMLPISSIGVYFLGRIMYEDSYASTKERLFKLDPKSTRQDLDDLKHYLNDVVSHDSAAAERVISNIVADDHKYLQIKLSSNDYSAIKNDDYKERIRHNKYINA